MAKEKRPMLSISLLASNRPDTIRRCLDSLKPIMEQISSELILVDTSEREEIKDLVSYDYDALMAQFQESVGLLMQKSQSEYGPKITHIIDKYLGKGKKISEATIEQAEIISLIVTEIKEDLVDKITE